jgi:hypothetical protein
MRFAIAICSIVLRQVHEQREDALGQRSVRRLSTRSESWGACAARANA